MNNFSMKKLILKESVDTSLLPDNILNLIEDDKWDEALEVALKSSQVTTYLDIPHDFLGDQNPIEYLREIKNVCNNNDVALKVTDSKNKKKYTLKLSGERVSSVIDKLDKDKKIGLPPYAERNEHQATSNKDELATLVIDYFVEKNMPNRASNFEDDTSGILHDIFEQLGLNGYDNPFIVYLNNFEIPNTEEYVLKALYNLYANKDINYIYLNDSIPQNKYHRILFSRALFTQFHSQKEIEDMVGLYNTVNVNNDNQLEERDSIFYVNGDPDNRFKSIREIKNMLAKTGKASEDKKGNDFASMSDDDLLNTIKGATKAAKDRKILKDN